MAKFYGKIGFATTVESPPGSGIWEDNVIEREYSGDLMRNSASYQTSDQVNDDLRLDNSISIVSDPYAYDNLSFMRYVEFMGVKWKIIKIEFQRPRLILTVGGVYNGQ